MFHGLSNEFLYSAFKIESTFIDDIASQKSISGTAFFVKNKDGQICLVTNRHVFDLNYQRTDQKYIRFKLDKVILSGKKPDEVSRLPLHDQSIRIHRVRHNVLYSQVYENDIACLINPAVELEHSTDQFLVEWFIPYELIASRENLDSKLSVCDFVAFPGYPPWYDRLNSRPILRTGTISSDPRFDYSHSGAYDGECIAYEAFSFGGSSGSPVFAVQKGPRPGAGITFPGFRKLMMIGINAGHLLGDQGIHSGISYMYKSSAILDIIDS